VQKPHTPGPSTAGHERGDVLTGITLLVISAAIFGVVDGLSKILADTQSVGQIVWARYALGLPVLLVTTKPASWVRLFGTKRPALQIARGLTPLVISVTMVLGVRYLPLAEATVILFAGPLFVLALSAPFLGERVGAASWISVIVGFIAVVVVARPGLSELSTYALFPLLGAVFFALLQLITRRLGAAGENPTTTLAWTLLVGIIVSTPFAAATWAPLTPTTWLVMIGLGLVFGVSQLLMIRALARAPAGLLAPFNYVQIVSAVIFGILVFGDVPDVWTFVGIVMIVGAGIFVARRRAT
jgi:drug/metabolite transporter (DMT)-like permease